MKAVAHLVLSEKCAHTKNARISLRKRAPLGGGLVRAFKKLPDNQILRPEFFLRASGEQVRSYPKVSKGRRLSVREVLHGQHHHHRERLGLC